MLSYEIERLLNYAYCKKLLKKHDIIPARNALLDLLGVAEPYAGAVEAEACETASGIINNILDEFLPPDSTATQRDLMDARIMGLLMPRASEVVEEFFRLYARDKRRATDYFYALSRDSNYIQVDRIKKNLYWTAGTEYGELELTVNLSKPEKDPREIELAKSMPQASYPKCLICAENAGFAGSLNHPARQNLRLIPLTLNGEGWYMQYSPYVYYNEHCIVLLDEHVPMKVGEKTIRRLADFVEMFPHYFLGSNAGLPIVGGSILSHDHYQGGRHVFPMETAKPYAAFTHRDYQGAKIAIVKWPMSVIRISSANKETAVRLAIHIMDCWEGYSDAQSDILPYTDGVPHNAVTPIARINANGEFEIDIVLRNNRTTAEFPYGIFHPHEELHHIKKENIGLIEVMGLAVLPGRLRDEFKEIEEILNGSAEPSAVLKNEAMEKHADWIKALIEKYGTSNADSETIIKNEAGAKFLNVLKAAGVFKCDEPGMAAFLRFCGTALGFEAI